MILVGEWILISLAGFGLVLAGYITYKLKKANDLVIKLVKGDDNDNQYQ